MTAGMTAQKLDGKATAAAIKEELRGRVAALAERGHTPGLGTLLVGEDAGSQKYVAGKHRDCAEVGIESIQRELPADATEEQILDVVRSPAARRGSWCRCGPGSRWR